MTRLKRRTDLPKWFDLDKYTPAKTFSLESWLLAFEHRWLLRLLTNSESPNPASLEVDEKWLEIVASGATAGVTKAGATRSRELSSAAIDDLSIIDLFNIRDSLFASPNLKKSYQSFERKLIRGKLGDPPVWCPEDLLESVHDVLDSDSYWLHNAAFAVVDLDASDTTIKEAFDKWLSLLRKSRNGDYARRRRYSAKDCDAWYGSAVLPYIDLCHWALHTGTHIPDRVLADAIFPSDQESRDTESIRKSTRPFAERVLSGELPDSLRADLYGADLSRHAPPPIGPVR